MKKIISVILVTLMLISFCACSTPASNTHDNLNSAANTLPTADSPVISTDPTSATVDWNEIFNIGIPSEVLGKQFVFASGAGAWGTSLYINADGSFEGNYHDTDTTTRYICKFSGEFESITQLNEYSYSLALKEITTENEPGQTWKEQENEYEITYITTGPHGMENSDEFILYMPNTPASEVSDELLSWRPDKSETQTLEWYCIYNPVEKTAFFHNAI